MKKPNIRVFIEVLKTLADQGFIDMEPTEGEHNLTSIYDFLVTSGIAERTVERYWLRLINEDACLMLTGLLKDLRR
jgi:hypothetical protein